MCQCDNETITDERKEIVVKQGVISDDDGGLVCTDSTAVGGIGRAMVSLRIGTIQLRELSVKIDERVW